MSEQTFRSTPTQQSFFVERPFVPPKPKLESPVTLAAQEGTVFSSQSPPHPEPRLFDDGTPLSPVEQAYLEAYETGKYQQYEPIDRRLEYIMEDSAARNQWGNKGST